VLGVVVITALREKTWLAPLLGVAGAAVLGAGLSASPARADDDTGTTTVNVEVGSTIALTDLSPSFTLSGNPGDTVSTGATPVTMTVTTNNFAGYTVTVEPATANLVGAIPGNTDTVPADDLEVDGPAQGGDYENLVFGTPRTVATKASASDPDGDTVINNYRLTVPFVRDDTYSGSLNYIVTTL
jgi:hypothetical protein